MGILLEWVLRITENTRTFDTDVLSIICNLLLIVKQILITHDIKGPMFTNQL